MVTYYFGITASLLFGALYLTLFRDILKRMQAKLPSDILFGITSRFESYGEARI